MLTIRRAPNGAPIAQVTDRAQCRVSNVFIHSYIRSRTAQRRNVVVLAAALLLWLVASATHLHTIDDDHDAPGKRPAVCSLCVLLPAGAAPPTQGLIATTLQVVRPRLAAPHVPVANRTVPSSYLSRGPPGSLTSQFAVLIVRRRL